VANFRKFFLFLGVGRVLGGVALPFGHFLDQTMLSQDVHFQLHLFVLEMGDVSRPIGEDWD